MEEKSPSSFTEEAIRRRWLAKCNASPLIHGIRNKPEQPFAPSYPTPPGLTVVKDHLGRRIMDVESPVKDIESTDKSHSPSLEHGLGTHLVKCIPYKRADTSNRALVARLFNSVPIPEKPSTESELRAALGMVQGERNIQNRIHGLRPGTTPMMLIKMLSTEHKNPWMLTRYKTKGKGRDHFFLLKPFVPASLQELLEALSKSSARLNEWGYGAARTPRELLQLVREDGTSRLYRFKRVVLRATDLLSCHVTREEWENDSEYCTSVLAEVCSVSGPGLPYVAGPPSAPGLEFNPKDMRGRRRRSTLASGGNRGSLISRSRSRSFDSIHSSPDLPSSRDRSRSQSGGTPAVLTKETAHQGAARDLLARRLSLFNDDFYLRLPMDKASAKPEPHYTWAAQRAFPGLPTLFTVHAVSVVASGLPGRPFSTRDGDSGQHIYWDWVPEYALGMRVREGRPQWEERDPFLPPSDLTTRHLCKPVLEAVKGMVEAWDEAGARAIHHNRNLASIRGKHTMSPHTWQYYVAHASGAALTESYIGEVHEPMRRALNHAVLPLICASGEVAISSLPTPQDGSSLDVYSMRELFHYEASMCVEQTIRTGWNTRRLVEHLFLNVLDPRPHVNKVRLNIAKTRMIFQQLRKYITVTEEGAVTPDVEAFLLDTKEGRQVRAVAMQFVRWMETKHCPIFFLREYSQSRQHGNLNVDTVLVDNADGAHLIDTGHFVSDGFLMSDIVNMMVSVFLDAAPIATEDDLSAVMAIADSAMETFPPWSYGAAPKLTPPQRRRMKAVIVLLSAVHRAMIEFVKGAEEECAIQVYTLTLETCMRYQEEPEVDLAHKRIALRILCHCVNNLLWMHSNEAKEGWKGVWLEVADLYAHKTSADAATPAHHHASGPLVYARHVRNQQCGMPEPWTGAATNIVEDSVMLPVLRRSEAQGAPEATDANEECGDEEGAGQGGFVGEGADNAGASEHHTALDQILLGGDENLHIVGPPGCGKSVLLRQVLVFGAMGSAFEDREMRLSMPTMDENTEGTAAVMPDEWSEDQRTPLWVGNAALERYVEEGRSPENFLEEYIVELCGEGMPQIPFLQARREAGRLLVLVDDVFGKGDLAAHPDVVDAVTEVLAAITGAGHRLVVSSRRGRTPQVSGLPIGEVLELDRMNPDIIRIVAAQRLGIDSLSFLKTVESSADLSTLATNPIYLSLLMHVFSHSSFAGPRRFPVDRRDIYDAIFRTLYEDPMAEGWEQRSDHQSWVHVKKVLAKVAYLVHFGLGDGARNFDPVAVVDVEMNENISEQAPGCAMEASKVSVDRLSGEDAEIWSRLCQMETFFHISEKEIAEVKGDGEEQEPPGAVGHGRASSMVDSVQMTSTMTSTRVDATPSGLSDNPSRPLPPSCNVQFHEFTVQEYLASHFHAMDLTEWASIALQEAQGPGGAIRMVGILRNRLDVYFSNNNLPICHPWVLNVIRNWRHTMQLREYCILTALTVERDITKRTRDHGPKLEALALLDNIVDEYVNSHDTVFAMIRALGVEIHALASKIAANTPRDKPEGTLSRPVTYSIHYPGSLMKESDTITFNMVIAVVVLLIVEDGDQRARSVDLHEAGIGDKGMKFLAEALKVNRTVREVNLSANHLTDRGAEYLAEALRVNTTIVHVDLDENMISDHGATALADALRVNTSLTALEMRDNPAVGYDGAKALQEAIEKTGGVKNVQNLGFVMPAVSTAEVLPSPPRPPPTSKSHHSPRDTVAATQDGAIALPDLRGGTRISSGHSAMAWPGAQAQDNGFTPAHGLPSWPATTTVSRATSRPTTHHSQRTSRPAAQDSDTPGPRVRVRGADRPATATTTVMQTTTPAVSPRSHKAKPAPVLPSSPSLKKVYNWHYGSILPPTPPPQPRWRPGQTRRKHKTA